jgi:signal transduction histidine kinase/ActR/RegA family two-component response regulator
MYTVPKLPPVSALKFISTITGFVAAAVVAVLTLSQSSEYTYARCRSNVDLAAQHIERVTQQSTRVVKGVAAWLAANPRVVFKSDRSLLALSPVMNIDPQDSHAIAIIEEDGKAWLLDEKYAGRSFDVSARPYFKTVQSTEVEEIRFGPVTKNSNTGQDTIAIFYKVLFQGSPLVISTAFSVDRVKSFLAKAVGDSNSSLRLFNDNRLGILVSGDDMPLEGAKAVGSKGLPKRSDGKDGRSGLFPSLETVSCSQTVKDSPFTMVATADPYETFRKSIPLILAIFALTILATTTNMLSHRKVGRLVSELRDEREELIVAEEAVRIHERRFRRLFENSEVSIWNMGLSDIYSALEALRQEGVTDLRQYLTDNEQVALDIAAKVKVIHVNEATLRLFGAKSANDFFSQIDTIFEPVPVDVFQNLHCSIWDRKKVFRYETTFNRLDGNQITGIISLSLPETEEGFKSIPVTIIDVTESRQLEEQLRQSQRMDAVGQLTGGIAHDFNNLLAIVIGHAELLGRRIGTDHEGHRNTDAIKQAVERGSSLTARLLAFSRKQPLSPTASDVSSLVYNLDDMFQRTLGETIDVKIVNAPNLWPVLVDRHQLDDALLNLAINARDAMPNGGNLTIEAANSTLDETYAQQQPDVIPGDYVTIAVTDTGVGISAEDLEKVFEPFFTTKEFGTGSGLGLSMVYGFIKQSNGHITIYSEVGQGTTVKLYLPRSQDGIIEGIRAGQTKPHAKGHEHILVVEDDEMVREIPVNILREQGYIVVEATSGDEAIKLLKGEAVFDLLFTDVVLPGGINGTEIAKKAVSIQPHIKVIYTTGYAENAVVHNSILDAGVTLVKKPYQRDELLHTVRETLDGKFS